MNMMLHFKFWDPMSIGAWMLGVFASSPSFPPSSRSWAARAWPRRRVVSLVGTIAVLHRRYTGVLLSATALPLWREARLMGALFLASGPSTGMAAISSSSIWPASRGGRVQEGQARGSYAIMFEILVLAAFVLSWRRRGTARDGPARASLWEASWRWARPSASRGSRRTQGPGAIPPPRPVRGFILRYVIVMANA